MTKHLALLTFLMVFALTAFAPSKANAAAVTCNDVLNPHEQTTKPHAELDKRKIEKSIQKLTGDFLSSDKTLFQSRYKVIKSLVDGWTAWLVGRHNIAYAFRYIRDGSVLKIRLWVVKGEAPAADEIKRLLRRYASFPSDLKTLIERTAYVRAQADKLEELSKLPKKDFPITFDAKMDGSNIVNQITFHDPKDVLGRLTRLKRSEPTIFDGGVIGEKFGNAFFLRSRRREQAHLERVLQIMLLELEKYPQAGHDPELRHSFITQARELLNNQDYQADGESRLLESRRALTEEIGYIFGRRDLSADAVGIAGQLYQGDRDGTGIDFERPGFFVRFLRSFGVKLPAILIAGAAIVYSPVIKDEYHVVKNEIYQAISPDSFRKQTLTETSQLPDVQFQQKAFELLENEKQAKVVAGKIVYTDEGQKTMEALREMRANYLQTLKTTLERDNSFGAALETGLTQDQVTGDEFNALMQMRKADFLTAARKIASRQSSLTTKRDVLKRLVAARAGYDVDRANAALHPNDSTQSSKSEALFDAFMGFVISTGQEAGTQ